MNENLQAYIDRRGQKGMDISKSVELFRRYAYVEQSCIRALAGWFLKMPNWESKIKLGYHLYAHAERLNELGMRLEELRGGRHRDANIEPGLARIGEELVQAPDDHSFIAGLSWMLGHLIDVYKAHLDVADASANALEIRILHRLQGDVENELHAVQELEKQEYGNSQVDTSPWTQYLEGLIEGAGGISGLGLRSGKSVNRPDKAQFDWPSPMVFDSRIVHADLGSYQSKLHLPLRERSIGEFKVYFNEFYAAALLATIIYDSWKLDAPRQYFMDIAHHFWDEVRHAEFGAIRLRELGVEPSVVNMVLFDNSQGLPLLHRLCYLTLGLEVYFMPRKSVRVRYYEQEGDPRSQLFADVDWSDESNHVRYGKQWMDYFLKDDARTIEDVQAEIAKYMENHANNMTEGQKVPW